MAAIDSDIKATVKKIIQGNEKRKRRVANGTASQFDQAAAVVIQEALNASCANVTSTEARAHIQKQIYKSIVHSMPYESMIDVICGRRQFYDYRTDFIVLVAEGLGMLPKGRTKRGQNSRAT